MRSKRHITKRAQQFAGRAERTIRSVAKPLAKYGFPWRAPTVPRGIEVPEKPDTLGGNFETDWARRPLASVARSAFIAGPLKIMTTVIARPEVHGLDRLADLSRLDDPPPLIFAPDHHSHLDTVVMIRAIPTAWRQDLVVAAAADYFFDKRWKATFSALALNAIPIDREATGRQSADLFKELIDDGRSLLIYPEGGRSPDGWAQPFKGGAAYLSAKTGVAVVPVHIEGTGAIFGKGMKRPRPGRTRVIFGAPLTSYEDENTRRYNARIESAVGRLTEESVSDYWTAARKASTGSADRLSGPETASWRRKWVLTDRRHREVSGRNSRPERDWPNLGPRAK